MSPIECENGHVTLFSPCRIKNCGAGPKLAKEAKRAANAKYAANRGSSGSTNSKALPVVIDTITFQSTGEGALYLWRKDQERRGEITGVVTQHPIAIRGPYNKRVALYNADLSYVRDNWRHYEDFKGRKMAVFSLKYRMLEAQGIKIDIITADMVPQEWRDLAVEIRRSGLDYFTGGK